jgi:hypothetical protein
MNLTAGCVEEKMDDGRIFLRLKDDSRLLVYGSARFDLIDRFPA